MRLRAAILALALTGGPAFAQDNDILDRCAQMGLGLPHCPTEDLQQALDRLSAGDFRQFRDLGMESYAMLTAMRHLAVALEWREGYDDNCRPSYEVYQAGELWFEWVRLPQGVTEDETADFQRYALILDHLSAAYVGGDCI
ncbi:hypothetical protein [Cognatiyoonia sp. IB215182]|uniref:hypothetical protein n=1 Tax=Cognatiyoonia sp. IB215182 TaxID=3097353 RepID=UPI002A0ECEE7|nr:hypothetical protein [Cognatiyoonia sp. IB215182]MDX8352321.1 hypothetical protein [Cognatiyoonia sp. IB215182]